MVRIGSSDVSDHLGRRKREAQRLLARNPQVRRPAKGRQRERGLGKGIQKDSYVLQGKGESARTRGGERTRRTMRNPANLKGLRAIQVSKCEAEKGRGEANSALPDRRPQDEKSWPQERRALCAPKRREANAPRYAEIGRR